MPSRNVSTDAQQKEGTIESQVLELERQIVARGDEATDWTVVGNNETFLGQRVAMTTNLTLSMHERTESRATGGLLRQRRYR